MTTGKQLHRAFTSESVLALTRNEGWEPIGPDDQIPDDVREDDPLDGVSPEQMFNIVVALDQIEAA